MKIYYENETDVFDNIQYLQEHLSRSVEAAWELSNLKKELIKIRNQRDELYQAKLQNEKELQTLRKAATQHEKKLLHQSKNQELQRLTNEPTSVTNATDKEGIALPIVPPTPPPPPPTPPPPPPPAPPAPPPPSSTVPPHGGMTTKRTVQLPTLNWLPLNLNQVKGTIFSELDYEKLHKQIDFAHFEQNFKIVSSDEVDGLNSFQSKRSKKPENVFVLNKTRLTNIAIFLRKLNMPIDLVVHAINNLDLKQLSLEKVEILQKIEPTQQEIKDYKQYAKTGDVNLLKEEDKFMLQLTKVKSISTNLSIMNYMGNFGNSLSLISPKIDAINKASIDVKSSQKFKAVLEVILAFGNYLNSSKKGTVYGFKLQSLDTLLDTKAIDKRMCLLHYIVATIRQKFTHLSNFTTELSSIDDAAQVLLDNVVTDVHEMEKGMDQARNEADKGQTVHVLRDFLNNSQEKLNKIKQDAKEAQRSFKECAEYFGESSGNADASDFFSTLLRFIKAVKTCDSENELRQIREQAAANKAKNPMK